MSWKTQIGKSIQSHRDMMGSWVTYQITPCAKPRMTQRDVWKKRPCVLKYRSFKDQCVEAKLELFESMAIRFYLPMPASWSKKKVSEMLGRPHTQRPDLDNLTKGLLDILEEDSIIWRIDAAKYWSERGSIQIRKI